MNRTRHYCPACSNGLAADSVGVPLLPCRNCGWKLFTLAQWKKAGPYAQGFAVYMQAAWPTSELKGQTNPYAEGTAKWAAYREGEQSAMLSAEDGEE